MRELVVSTELDNNSKAVAHKGELQAYKRLYTWLQNLYSEHHKS